MIYHSLFLDWLQFLRNFSSVPPEFRTDPNFSSVPPEFRTDPKNEYNRMIGRQKSQLKAIEDKIELLETPNRGKIEPQLRYSINLIDNIDKFFMYAPVEAKIRALSSIFPEKIEFDGNNFRTVSMNSVLGLIYQQTNELRGLNKKSEESFSTFPASVPRAGVEPAQG